MTITAQQLADLLGGTVEGDSSVIGIRPGVIESAVEGDICFYSNEKYEKHIYTTSASILLIPNTYTLRQPVKPTLSILFNRYFF